jgi:hypothetical protein
MFVIWLLERGIAIASSMLHKVTGVAQSSALNLLRKIATVIEARMESGAIEVPSSRFAAGIYKRSRETPAREHPSAEEEALHKNKEKGASSQNEQLEPPAPTTRQGINPFANRENIQLQPLTETEQLIFDLLDETPKNVETLCEQFALSTPEIAAALTMLEFYGLVRTLPGGRAARCKKSNSSEEADASFSAEVKAAIADMNAYVLNIHFGVSRKYYQKYAAMYSCIANGEKWKDGSLMEECLAFPLIRYSEMLGYVTAPMVKIMLRWVG